MLSLRRQRFVQEYLIDLNATRAAARAGYSSSTSYVQGPRLLKNAEVRAAVHAGMDARAKRMNLAADAALTEIAEIALHRMTVGLGRRFARGIRMASKQKALDQLHRHLGLHTADIQSACAAHFASSLRKTQCPTDEDDDAEQPSASEPPTDDPPAHFCDWLPPS